MGMPRRHLLPCHRSVRGAHSFLATLAPDSGDIDSHREAPPPRAVSLASGPHAGLGTEHSCSAGELARSRSRMAALALARHNLLQPLPLAGAFPAGGRFRGRARSPSPPSNSAMESAGNFDLRLSQPVPARTSHDPLRAPLEPNCSSARLISSPHILSGPFNTRRLVATKTEPNQPQLPEPSAIASGFVSLLFLASKPCHSERSEEPMYLAFAVDCSCLYKNDHSGK